MNKPNTAKSNCEDCVHFCYDEELEADICDVDLDEDELMRFLNGENQNCPYYDRFDEYKLGRPRSGNQK